MNDPEVMDLRLWDYIDATGMEAERQATAALIAADPAWKVRYEELKETHLLLQSLETSQPSMRFSMNVMEAISHTTIAAPARTYVNKWIIRGIAAVFIILTVLLLGTAVASVDWTQQGTPRFHLPQWKPISADQLLNGKLLQYLLPLNIIGALILLDTWQRRRKSGQYHT